MSLERQLFSWSGWQGDREFMTFYDVVLAIKIGEHEAGTKFEQATVDWSNSKLQLDNKSYDLKLSVKEEE